MKSNSPHNSNPNLSNLYNTDNCDCLCHYPEDMDINHQSPLLHKNIPKTSNSPSFHRQSPSPNRLNILSQKSTVQTKNEECLCICDKVCPCPCHCVTCVCCPCVKEKKGDYYKNLYAQLKSELEIEKRRSDRMKFDREMNKQNIEKEKKNLILENTQLKKQLDEVMARLEQEEEKNTQRDEELYNFKNDELPKLQESYENLIKTVKEDKDKQINDMNNKMAALAKENVSLKYQIKRKNKEEQNNLNQIIDKLNIEINELKNELESRNQIIDKLNSENEEINAHTEEIKSQYNKEIQDLKNQNMKLNKNLNSNLSEIKKLKDELNRVRKNKTNDEQMYLKLKNGNENKDNEINNLKRLLIEKEDEIEALAG